jgi:hypothetical protein
MVSSPVSTSSSSDADEPGIKAGVSLKFAEVLEGFEESLLHGVFGVFAILGDVLREAENLALVTAHESFERVDVACLRGSYEDRLVILHHL